MKKLIQIIILLIPLAAIAQTNDNLLPVSLEQAIHIGLENRFDNKANQLSTAMAESRISQAKNNWLPEIHAAADVKYSPQLQNSLIPGGVLKGFDESMMLPLTVKNLGIFGLQLEQPVFDATLRNKRKLAENDLALQKEKVKEQETAIRLAISQAYMNAQLRALQQKIAADITNRNVEYVQIAEGKYRNGSLIENYYLRAKLDKDNAASQLRQATQEYEISIAKLRYCLNLPANTILQLTDSLDAPKDITVNLVQTQEAQRPELKQLFISKEADELHLKAYQQQLLPKVSFVANYSQQFQSNNFDYDKGRSWSPFSYGMLQVRLPIAAHYKNKPLVLEARQRLKQTEWLIAQKSADLQYEVYQAGIALANAVTNMNTSRSNYELSKTILQNQQQQYKLGAFDYTELLNTEKTLSNTEKNFVESAYELLLARINLLKATNQF